MVGYFDAKTVIKAFNYVPAGTIVHYTASANCWVSLAMVGYNKDGGRASIGGINVALAWSESEATILINSIVPLKKGQTIDIYSPTAYATSYAVYSMF